MRKLAVVLVAALVGAALISLSAGSETYPERLTRAAAQEALPEAAAMLKSEPAAVNAVFLGYAGDQALVLNARLALLRYPDKARRVLTLYGTAPAFTAVLKEYGPAVVPPIHYFLVNRVRTLELMRYTGETLEAAQTMVENLWGDVPEDSPPQANVGGDRPLTPVERGWYAIAFIQREGHSFLGQFVLDADGSVEWVQSERAMQGVADFFTGGVRTLETKYRRDETLSGEDYLWAGVDVLVAVASLKALRAARLGTAATGAGAESAAAGGEAAAAGARASRTTGLLGRAGLATADLSRAAGIGGRVARYGAVAAAAYLVVRHPGLITGFAGDVARVAGLPPWLVQFGVWALLLLPAFYLALFALRLVLRPTVVVIGIVGRGMSWLERRRIRSAAAN